MKKSVEVTFCYHFWPKHMPKLSCYLKKGEPAPLEQVEDEHARQKVLETYWSSWVSIFRLLSFLL